MEYYNIAGVVALTHYDGDHHLANFNRLIEDLVSNTQRNQIIANIVLASYDVQFLLVTASHRHVELLNALLVEDERFYTITHEDVNEIIHNQCSDFSRFHTRCLAISFPSLEKLVAHTIANLDTPSILDTVGGFIVGTPHKNLDFLIEYVYQFHNSSVKSRRRGAVGAKHGTVFHYRELDMCGFHDIVDNHELLSMWGKWHEEKYHRCKLMDPSPPAHRDGSKETSNVVKHNYRKTNHDHGDKKYHGIINDLDTGFVPRHSESKEAESKTADCK